MHPSVLEWVAKKVVEHGLRKPDMNVLEVGSRDVNGSIRPLFQNVASYTGVDFIDGPGVDLVLDAHKLTSAFARDSFDVVISTEMLEHDSEFWLSMAMMGDVLKPGGLLLITARGNGFWIHGYPTITIDSSRNRFPVCSAALDATYLRSPRIGTRDIPAFLAWVASAVRKRRRIPQRRSETILGFIC